MNSQLSVALERFAQPPVDEAREARVSGKGGRALHVVATRPTERVAQLALAGRSWPTIRRMVIMDAVPLFREALAMLALRMCPGARVDMVETIRELWDLDAGGDPPDLVVVDLDFPGFDITAGLAEIRKRYRHASLVALSTGKEDASASLALTSGADGVIDKAVTSQALVDAIERILAGEYVLEARKDGSFSPQPSHLTPISLTERQKEVLELLGESASNKLIARELGISHLTVRLHVSSLMRTFGVTRRQQVVKKARLFGLHI